MKETLPQNTDNVSFVKPAKHQKKPVFVGAQKLKRNHTLFEINVVELTIAKAKYFDTEEVTFEQAKKGIPVQKKIALKENCVYFSALNFKNALHQIEQKSGASSDFKIIK